MLMGKQRLEGWGLPPEAIPLGGYIYEAWQHQDPLYGLGMLGYFETKNIGRKRERAAAFHEMGDTTSEIDMEFDWAMPAPRRVRPPLAAAPAGGARRGPRVVAGSVGARPGARPAARCARDARRSGRLRACADALVEEAQRRAGRPAARPGPAGADTRRF